ncbi:MAG: co-chaperone GroES [Nanoarchaeota archaeon]|nr:co-chaperone GroES [Nanoarchaeota archaeon]MBU1103051.1 co-chaperone GroES [Nanoarchaeota archaeon]
MKLIPLGERIVIKTIEPEEKTKSGIYLPKSSEEKKQGEVVEVGTLKDGSLIPLKKGDKIIYGGYSSEEFEFENQKLLIVDYKDVLARIEDSQERPTERNFGGFE